MYALIISSVQSFHVGGHINDVNQGAASLLQIPPETKDSNKTIALFYFY
jgi:hypothetical protein